MLPQLTLSGPTHFNKILSEINGKHVEHDLYYKVLVIITDGEPNDLNQTIDKLVVSSHKPISIILISVQMAVNDKIHYNQLENNFAVLKKLSSEIQYSKQFDCYQARQNVIYRHYKPTQEEAIQFTSLASNSCLDGVLEEL
jgi:uncharacterized protein YegL